MYKIEAKNAAKSSVVSKIDDGVIGYFGCKAIDHDLL